MFWHTNWCFFYSYFSPILHAYYCYHHICIARASTIDRGNAKKKKDNTIFLLLILHTSFWQQNYFHSLIWNRRKHNFNRNSPQFLANPRNSHQFDDNNGWIVLRIGDVNVNSIEIVCFWNGTIDLCVWRASKVECDCANWKQCRNHGRRENFNGSRSYSCCCDRSIRFLGPIWLVHTYTTRPKSKNLAILSDLLTFHSIFFLVYGGHIDVVIGYLSRIISFAATTRTNRWLT